MSGAPTITTPLAQNQTSTATVCMPWFVDKTEDGPVEFHPVACSYQPLVNGKEAFGAVYDAIHAAKYSVDIICWGFQPSMYFKRNDGGASLNIGDLLASKGLEGVRVRILCWADFWAVAQTTENSTPGLDWIRSRVFQNENNTEREYDRAWYSQAGGVVPGSIFEDAENQAAAARRAQLKAGVTPTMPKPVGAAQQMLPGIQMVTRDFSFMDRLRIAYRELTSRSDKALNEEAILLSFTQEPSHHQKMVLVDYEAPEHAVGFVMGHNTLDAYWDDDAHSYGLKQDEDAARRYIRKAADLGNADAQYYIGDLLAPDNMAPDIAYQMFECAADQGHGKAANDLGIIATIKHRYPEAVQAFQKAAASGETQGALALEDGFKGPAEEDRLNYIGVDKDLERSQRYKIIGKFIDSNDGRNPKIPEIDKIVPLPPAKLPPWDGTFQWQIEQDAAVPPQKPSDEVIKQLAKARHLDPATGLPLAS